MEPRAFDETFRRSRVQRLASTWPVLLVTLVMILAVSAPVAAGATAGVPGEGDATAQQSTGNGAVQQIAGAGTTQQDDATMDGQWTDPVGQLDQVGVNQTIDEEKRNATEEGVDEAVATLQRRGVAVNQSQRTAAVDGSLVAVGQYHNASVEQIQNASYGAVTGTFLQSGNVTVEQVQNATTGGVIGALAQHENASATQLHHAAHGATHGAVAQQNATVEQVQIVAQGAAAGAAHEAGKHDGNDSERVHPGAIREAAQGAAFGALAGEQNVTVEQRLYAATGAAEGALNQSQSVAVEQTRTASVEANGTASVKQIQVAAMGAAKGSLSMDQRRNVTVRQVQAAARGACKGALAQVQEVSVIQLQGASFGAAKGAISQSQRASVTQIQAAATGGAHGAIVQRQSVSITQVQYAASGAAKGAAKSAAQNQVANVEQIEAAAAGAGQGSVVQIQQIDAVAIQIITESAADGALSQHQEADVVQIQSAARGASEGSISLSQRQEVTVEQVQIVTQRVASDTAATAARMNIDVDTTIYNYAKGASENPDDADDQIRSLFVSADQESISLANPNGVPVTVTITSDDGDLETVTLAAGESTSVERDGGTYTLTAETADGEDVELAGRAQLTLSIGEALQSLSASVEGQQLAVENPNDERVTVDVEGDVGTSFDVPGNWDGTQPLAPGTYTATAETQDGEPVQIDGNDVFEFTIEPEEPEEPEPEEPEEPEPEEPEPEEPEPDEPAEPETGEPDEPEEPEPDEPDSPEPDPIDVNASVDGPELTVENPSENDVVATATSEDGVARTFDVPAGENATESFDPGTYNLTGDADGDREVQINGGSAFEFTVDPSEPIDVNVTVDGQNVSFDNPSEAAVTITATDDVGEAQPIDLPGGENVTEALAPGNYTLTGESDDDREVLLDDESELTIGIDQPTGALESLNVTVEGQNVTLANPNDVPVTIAVNATDAEGPAVMGGEGPTGASAEDPTGTSVEDPTETSAEGPTAAGTETRTVGVPPESNVTEAFEPGNYTLTAATEAGTTVSLENETELEIAVEPVEPTATGTLAVEDQAGDGTEFVVANASATVPFVLEVDYDGETALTGPFDAGEQLDDATMMLEPPIEDDGDVTVTVRASETDEALANETVAYDVAEATANVSVNDQTTDGTAVVVNSANLTEGGFLAIHEESANGTDDVLGTSEFLPPGPHENVTVPLEQALTADATVDVTAHRDTNDDGAFDFVTTDGAEDVPYVDGTGDPVASGASLTVETEPEPEIEYVNCTTARVNGTYDRLGVTLNYYTQDGNTTSEHLWTGADVQGDRPVDGQTLVTIGETNETMVTDDGVQVVRIADPGSFGDAEPDQPGAAGQEPFGDGAPGGVGDGVQSFVLNANTSASPTGQEDLSAAQPNGQACRENVRPDPPTLGIDRVEDQGDETAQVTLGYENPNDAPLVPAESTVSSGGVVEDPPETLEPGQQSVVVEWTPASPEENVTWALNLSNFDLANASTTSQTAGEVEGLLEPPEGDVETGTQDGTAGGTTEDTPTPDGTPLPPPDDEPGLPEDEPGPEDEPVQPPDEPVQPTDEPVQPPGDTPENATG